MADFFPTNPGAAADFAQTASTQTLAELYGGLSASGYGEGEAALAL